jgi:small-conductance mechanosensitive channel
MPDRTGRIVRPRTTLLWICSAALLAACQGPASPLGPHDLSLAAADLRSMGSESALLTEQLADGSVSGNFGWVHQQALGQSSANLAERLARPAPPAQRARHERLLLLHARLEAALERIGFAADDRAALQELRNRFTQIQAAAAAMQEPR